MTKLKYQIRDILTSNPGMTIKTSAAFPFDIDNLTVQQLRNVYDNLKVDQDSGNSLLLGSGLIRLIGELLFEESDPLGTEFKEDPDVLKSASQIVAPLAARLPSSFKGVFKGAMFLRKKLYAASHKSTDKWAFKQRQDSLGSVPVPSIFQEDTKGGDSVPHR
jgi:hypothetical protein